MRTVALGEICRIEMGQAPPGDSYNVRGEGLPLVAGAGDFAGVGRSVSKYTTSPTKISSTGDIILSIRASIGARVWSDRPYCLGRGVAGLRPTDDLDARYLWHWLEHSAPILARQGRGATFLQVSRADIAVLAIPEFPLDEQRRIAAILDKADEIRTKRREALAHLDTLASAAFQRMFGGHLWPTATLNEVSLRSGEYGANVPSTEPATGLPRYVRITDITERGTLAPECRAPGGDPHLWSRYMLADGDLLFARSGATVGKAYRYRTSDGPCVFAGYLIRFRPDPDLVDPDYVFGFTRTKEYATWVTNHQNVVAQPNINAKQYGSELRLPLPPMALQRKFAAQVEAIDAERTTLERALAADDELFASLQSRAFRGEL